jgi:phosphatidate cytidylyltransferase
MNGMLPLDPIASRTLLLLVGFFGAAGIAVFAYEQIKKTVDKNLRQRYFSWYIIAPVVLLPAYFGGLLFAVLVTFLSFFALREFFEVAHVKEIGAYKWTGRILGILLIFTAIYNAKNIPLPFSLALPWWQGLIGPQPVFGIPVFYVMPVFVIMLILIVPLALGKYEGMLMKESATIFGVLYFGWFFGHLIFLRDLPDGFGYLIFLSVVVVLNDVLAYTVGKIFGRHKMTPVISPKKTWEGALGGMAGSLLGAVVFKYAVPALSWTAVLGAAVIIGITAPLGDLIVSVIKRDMSVKDSGNMIPGHGGLLDRCDSLIFATPAFYYYLLLVQRMHW